MQNFGWSAVDIGIVLLIMISAVFAAWHGIIRSLFALLASVLALVAAFVFTAPFADAIPFFNRYPLLATLIAFIVIFVGVLAAVGIPGGLAAKLMKVTGMKFLDHSMGLVFGVLRGVILILALVWLTELIPGFKIALEKEQSLLLPHFSRAVDLIKPYLSDFSLPE
ncbi:MAG: CvpA family protein [Burkholderiales bacterium]|jgi:membrane protein required for colicin V production|nr:CvpA family protein [Burkholderiales bacterium]